MLTPAQLSQTLSHVSLNQSTHPYARELSPDAMTRTAASSSPPLMSTPATVVADTPRRLPGLRRLNTPAPLTTRDMGYPNTAPMPVIHSLLGSPFDSKARLYPLELQSPTWLAKPPNKEMPVWNTDWLEEKDVLPELQESPYAPAPKGYATAYDSGSCTSSSSSFFSSERHGAQHSASSRPSVVDIWSGDSTFYDEDAIPTPNRQLFGKPRVNESILLSTRLLQSSPGQTSPLMGKRVPLPSPTGSSLHSPQPLTLSRIASASSTSALENEPIHSPTRVGVTASMRNRGRINAEAFDDDLLSIPADSLLQRRTSDPVQSSGDAFAVFLARCGGDRATRSEMASHGRSSEPPPEPSSEPNELEFELSPLRSVAHRSVPVLPPRAGSAPLPPRLTMKTRIERLKNSPKPDGTSKTTTPKRGPKATASPPSTRPLMRRGVTAPQVPSIPLFGTPISQLFGDDKPSPAAFASAGLVKKRGSKTTFPRFKDKGREWSPMPAAVARSEEPSEQSAERAPPASTAPVYAVPSLYGQLRDNDRREVLSQDFDMEDTDEDDVSPIRPMRSAFRRSIGGHHRRVSSTTSDIMTSPASRRKRGHVRMSSTASSIGGSRGLRRKGSTMFNSGASITSDSEKPSPATPTKAIPFASSEFLACQGTQMSV